MPTSVRMDADTERLLEALASRLAVSRSEVIRRAVRALSEAERSARTRPQASPYERANDLLGSVTGGPPDLSAETGRRFAELLEAQRSQGRKKR
jgi:hypothetical protein